MTHCVHVWPHPAHMDIRSDVCRHAVEGEALTLVCTDVEGSTELWEWDNAAMLDVRTLEASLHPMS